MHIYIYLYININCSFTLFANFKLFLIDIQIIKFLMKLPFSLEYRTLITNIWLILIILIILHYIFVYLVPS